MTVEELAFHEYFMGLALREAELSSETGEVPCGCVIVELPKDCLLPGVANPKRPRDPCFATVLAQAHNQTETLHDPTAHAEILAIRAATKVRGDWRLTRTFIYVTKEPCPMCAGSLIWARPAGIVWGFGDPDRGGESAFGILSDSRSNHRPFLLSGILEASCREQFIGFFRARRKESRQ